MWAKKVIELNAQIWPNPISIHNTYVQFQILLCYFEVLLQTARRGKGFSQCCLQWSAVGFISVLPFFWQYWRSIRLFSWTTVTVLTSWKSQEYFLVGSRFEQTFLLWRWMDEESDSDLYDKIQIPMSIQMARCGRKHHLSHWQLCRSSIRSHDMM
jgi:hypothetical protein